MVDEEVEIALREIRERIISQPLTAPRDGAAGPEDGDSALQIANHGRSAEAIARLNAHLTTSARAWDRLPPVFSNRSGTAARLELWLKARLKTLTRWFTWEQVNFNAAVHHALKEALQALTEQNATIAALQSTIAASQPTIAALQSTTAALQSTTAALQPTIAALQSTIAALESRLDAVDALRAELGDELDINRDDIHSLRAQIQADVAAKHIELQNQQREINSLRAEMRGEIEALKLKLADQIAAQQRDGDARIAQLADEIREVENEQRVALKQFSLEINEYAVSLDRAQRSAGRLIKELEERSRNFEGTRTPPSKS